MAARPPASRCSLSRRLRASPARGSASTRAAVIAAPVPIARHEGSLVFEGIAFWGRRQAASTEMIAAGRASQSPGPPRIPPADPNANQRIASGSGKEARSSTSRRGKRWGATRVIIETPARSSTRPAMSWAMSVVESRRRKKRTWIGVCIVACPSSPKASPGTHWLRRDIRTRAVVPAPSMTKVRIRCTTSADAPLAGPARASSESGRTRKA